MENRLKLVVVATIAALGIAACDGTTTLTDPESSVNTIDSGAELTNITETAAGAESLSTLVAALQVAELDSVLADESQKFTVLAPTNDAFTALGSDTVQGLLADKEALSQVLLSHVISGEIDRATMDSFAGESLETVSTSNVIVQTTASGLYVNGSKVIGEVATTNGIVYIVDAVVSEGETLRQTITIPAKAARQIQAPMTQTLITQAKRSLTILAT